MTTQKIFMTSCLSILLSNCLTNTTDLNSQHIPRYIDHVVDQLMGINNQYDSRAQSDIYRIKERAIKVSEQPTFLERIFSLDVERTEKQVQNNIFSSIIDFVENQSYAYASVRTNSDAIARQIALQIRNSLEHLLAQTGELPAGILSGFIGYGLVQKVDDQLHSINIAAGAKVATSEAATAASAPVASGAAGINAAGRETI